VVFEAYGRVEVALEVVGVVALAAVGVAVLPEVVEPADLGN